MGGKTPLSIKLNSPILSYRTQPATGHQWPVHHLTQEELTKACDAFETTLKATRKPRALRGSKQPPVRVFSSFTLLRTFVELVPGQRTVSHVRRVHSCAPKRFNSPPRTPPAKVRAVIHADFPAWCLQMPLTGENTPVAGRDAPTGPTRRRTWIVTIGGSEYTLMHHYDHALILFTSQHRGENHL